MIVEITQKLRARFCYLIVGISYFRSLPFFLLFILTTTLYSQSYLIHTYTEYDGLPSSYVKDMAQDSLGCIWFTTRGGIAVYDGSEWKRFSVSDGLPGPNFQFIRIDPKGTVWALTRVAISIIWYLRDMQWLSIPTPFESYKKRGSITSFELALINNETVLAVGSRVDGLYIFSNNQWHHITEKDGLSGNQVNAIASYNELFYIATNNGLSIINGGEVDNSLGEKLRSPSKEIVGLAIENIDISRYRPKEQPLIWLQGKDWIGTIENQVFHLISDSIETHRAVNFFQPVLQPDYRNGLFFGSLADVFHIRKDNGSVTRLGPENGLIATGTTSMLLDREKNLWISGLRGVSKIVSMRFANYSRENGLLDDEVAAIIEVSPGTMLFGHNNGLTFFISGKYRQLTFSEDILQTPADVRVMDLRKDNQGNVWAAVSSLGIAKIDRTGSITWYRNNQGPEERIFSVMVDHLGEVWAGGNFGLFVLKDDTFMPFESEAVRNVKVRRIIETVDHTVYLTTISQGIFVFKNGRWKQYLSPHNENYNSTFCVFTDQHDNILVGSSGGLVILDNNILKKYNNDNFQIDQPVFFIIEDKKGRKWFGTDDGVIRWDGNNVRRYSIYQGLAGKETNRAAGFVDSQARVWIGTNGGVSLYQEEFDDPTAIPPIVELSRIEASGKELHPEEKYKLKHNQNNLAFHFRVTSFIDESNVTIKTKLEGLEENWFLEQKSQRRMMQYAHLNPGKYQFHLQVKNVDSGWSKIILSPIIHIKKPFWREWWFTLLCFTLAGFAFYGIQRYFEEKRYSSRLEKDVLERTRELRCSKDRLKTSVQEKEVLLKEIHHRVKNNLQVISSLLNLQSRHVKDQEDLKLFKDSQNRVKSMALIHEKLYESKDLVRINFMEYVRDLSGYLFRSHNVDPDYIDLKINVGNVSLAIDTAISCGLIIHELVSNALKYAFRNEEKGEIQINFRIAENGKLILSVSDNGIGFPENLNFRNTESLGLQLVNTLVKQIDGNIELNSEGGTEFRIIFNQ